MKNKLIKALFALILFTLPFSSLADDIDNGNVDGDVQDIPTAPIDDYIIEATFTAIVLTFMLLKNRKLKI